MHLRNGASDKETMKMHMMKENARPTSAESLPRYADTGLGVARYSAVEVEEAIDLVNDEGGTV